MPNYIELEYNLSLPSASSATRTVLAVDATGSGVFVNNLGQVSPLIQTVETTVVTSGSIIIPEPKLSVIQYRGTATGTEVNDVLNIRWENPDDVFLSCNPEVWLFTYSSYMKKFSIGDDTYKLKKRKWKHPSHLNGLKYPSGSYFAGNTRVKVSETILFSAGMHTEWPLVSDSMNMMTIPIDFGEWFYLKTSPPRELTPAEVENPQSVLTDISIRGGGKHKEAGANMISKIIAFAIVIDNPNPNTTCTKLFGPMSEKVAILCPKSSAYGSRFKIVKR